MDERHADPNAYCPTGNGRLLNAGLCAQFSLVGRDPHYYVTHVHLLTIDNGDRTYCKFKSLYVTQFPRAN